MTKVTRIWIDEAETMTDNQLTDGVINTWFNAAKAAIHHPATTRSEHSHAFAAYMLAQEVKKLREGLQQRRLADKNCFIKLPSGTGWSSDPYNHGRNDGIRECADAIRAAGIGIAASALE